MKIWVLETFTAYTVKQMKLAFIQMVHDYKYESFLDLINTRPCILIIQGHEIHGIIPSWWKKFRFSLKSWSFRYLSWKTGLARQCFDNLNSSIETHYSVKWRFNTLCITHLEKMSGNARKFPKKWRFSSLSRSRISWKILNS